ncbi:MAG: alginate export family protein [Phycisphaerae bacterium]|nr:alginate export family protein [Phycisphaerae bacterium]
MKDKKDTKLRLALIFTSLCFCKAVQGQEEESYDTPQEKITDWKNPADWLELGADLRLRTEYDNNRRLDKDAAGHERVVLPRFRARAGVRIGLTDDIDFNIRFAMEPRYYIRPLSQDPQFIRNEILLDKFNLTCRKAFGLPLTIVAGRQELKLGSGWLIAEGTPLDGSRTAFFDALRLTYILEESDTTVDFVWVENHADSAKLFKPFNDRDEDFLEQDEQGAIFYFAKKTGKDAGIDAYFIYKHDYDRAVSSGYEGEIYTPGVRKYGRLNEHWQYHMEFAPQFGHKNGKNLGAFATNNQLIYNYNDEKQNKIYLGYEYLSGNDDKDKNFDRGWARTDTWSVLYQGGIDSIDGRSYDNSNMHRIYADWETNPAEKMNLRCGYALLFADENTSAGGSGGMSKAGNFRGQLLKAMIKYKASKMIEHRIEGEAFFPGDFYNKDKNDPAVLVRYGLYLTW